MAVAQVRKHTDAVIAVLEAAGLTVGRASGEGLTAPYVVVYPIAGGTMTGPLEGIHDDATLLYQLTCVGVGPEQVEWLSDKCRDVLLPGLTVAGRSITLIQPDFGTDSVLRDNDVMPPLFYATPRFRINSVPA